MRSTIFALSVVLAIFVPSLRSQAAPGVGARYLTLSSINKGEVIIIWRTVTDKGCYIEGYRYDRLVNGTRDTELSPVNNGFSKYSCDRVAKEVKDYLKSSPKDLRPRSASLAADAASSPTDLLWILSDTPPNSAPATDGAVYAVDQNTLQTVATILTPGPIPLDIAASHGGGQIYATIQGVPAGQLGLPAHPPLIEVISTSTFAITQTINLPDGVNPGRLALSPDDRYLYVPSDGNPSGVFVVDSQNPASITTIPVTKVFRFGTSPVSVNRAAITPDGALLFLIHASATPADVYVIDTATGQQIGDIVTGSEPLDDLVIDPTGSRLYAVSQTHVYAYDTAKFTQIGSVLTKAGVQLSSIGMAADGSLVLANDLNSTAVFAIDPVTLAVNEVDVAAPPAFPSGESPVAVMVVQ